MKAVVGILVIFVGFFIEYSVFTGKLPPSGGIQPPATQSSSDTLPTTSSTSSGFSATTGQGSTSGNMSVYNPPPVAGRKV